MECFDWYIAFLWVKEEKWSTGGEGDYRKTIASKNVRPNENEY